MNAPLVPRSVKSLVRSAAIVLPAVLLVAALTWPLYLSNSSFQGSWSLHLWFIWKQSLTIAAGHPPSLFLNYPEGVFYPEYAFYAGLPYTLAGAVSAMLGGAPVATYVASYLLAFAAAYGGWYWIARQAGLGRWQGQVPGFVFITSSYYLTMIYADGDWAEFIAISTIPMTIAAGLNILRAKRLRLWPALALTCSCTVLFGTHLLTLVWGGTTIGLVGLATVVCIPQARRMLSRRGAGRLARLAIPAALVCAWFLVPAAANESSTYETGLYSSWRGALSSSMYLVSTRHLFTLSRASASPYNAGFALSLPVLVMAWALVSLVLALLVGRRGPWMRMALICASFTTLMIVLMTHAGLILALPRYYSTLQYSYRLENYVMLGVSGTVLCVLVLAQDEVRRLRWARWALAPILVVAAIGAIQEAAAYPSTPGISRSDLLAGWLRPPSAFEASSYLTDSSAATSSQGVLKDYLDVDQPILNGTRVHQSFLSGTALHPPSLSGSFEALPFAHFNVTSVSGERISATFRLHPGELVNSNLFASSSFVKVTGARIVGINDGDGSDVLEIEPPSSSAGGLGSSAEAATISVAPSSRLPIVLGRVLTVCALIALVLQLGLLAIRSRKRAAWETPAPI